MTISARKIEHVLCPTDLSARSQQTLNFASGIASRLKVKLTACHFSPTAWLLAGYGLGTKRSQIEQEMAETIRGSRNGSAPEFTASVFENSIDPAHDILELAQMLSVDMIVMKARKSVFSALHYGSIVERITRGSSIPMLLLPTNFIDSNSAADDINFNEVLFDYDFSEATDNLFPFAMELTKGFNANLHLLAVLEPPQASVAEAASTDRSRKMLLSATQQRLENLTGIDSSPKAIVEWGQHADTVLAYADKNNIDLICTTLPPMLFFYEKLYCAYLGQLLQSAKCPILTLRSV
jgi:nucleotide-binding universal stress UspA family protein